MAARDAVRLMAFGRVAIGVAMLIAPRRAAALWVGADADSPGASVLGRALGARDAIFGGMLLHTLDHPQVGRRWTMTVGACDTVDGLAALAVRRELPPARGLLGTAMALGSGAAHLALAGRLTSPEGLADVAAQSPPAPASSPEAVMPDGADEAERAMGAREIGVEPPA